MHPNKDLKSALTSPNYIGSIIDQEKTSERIKLAISEGANVYEVVNNLDYIDLEVINHNKEILVNAQTSEEASLIMKKLVALAIHHTFPYQSPPLKKALQEIISYATTNGLDLNTQMNEDDELTIFENLFIKEFEIADEFTTPDSKISNDAWIMLLLEYAPNIKSIAERIQKFPNHLIDEENFYSSLRALGVSNTSIKGKLDIYHLAMDYLKTKENNAKLLSDEELSLLDNDIATLAVESYDNITTKNNYGFGPLHLALLGHKIDLAIEMIKHGHSLIAKSVNGIIPLNFISSSIENSLPGHKELAKIAFHYLEEVDVILNDQQESAVDSLINTEMKDGIISKTRDPLFKLLKEGANLLDYSENNETARIAISHSEGFWSTGIFSWARMAVKEYPMVEFNLVTPEAIEKGGDAFIKQFDGWINPGGGDDYPRGKQEFSYSDWDTDSPIIKMYQLVLDKVIAAKIPNMGICAGAQNMVLHQGGHLQPVNAYCGGNHIMFYLKGSLPHFMAMTKDQQKIALKNCELPEISFHGDTAHSYAAVTGKLGNGLELGAISESGLPMSYALTNGLGYATQFHPEHHFIQGEEINHQHELLSNFVELAIMHHNYIIGKHEHPEIFLQQISDRLKECVENPTCMSQNDFVFSNATAEQILFD